jgi:hypothetical protein
MLSFSTFKLISFVIPSVIMPKMSVFADRIIPFAHVYVAVKEPIMKEAKR